MSTDSRPAIENPQQTFNRLGLLGGSFNPIHFGHLISARSVAEQLNLPKIILIPAGSPPHKPQNDLAPADQRLAMARLAVEGDPLFDVSDVELHRSGPSYTFETVTALVAIYGPQCRLHWIIGADTLPELETWHRIADLARLVEFVTVIRPGSHALQRSDLASLESKIGSAELDRVLRNRLTTPAIDISATDIRRRAAQGLPLRYLTPDAVMRYIVAQSLYRTR